MLSELFQLIILQKICQFIANSTQFNALSALNPYHKQSNKQSVTNNQIETEFADSQYKGN